MKKVTVTLLGLVLSFSLLAMTENNGAEVKKSENNITESFKSDITSNTSNYVRNEIVINIKDVNESFKENKEEAEELEEMGEYKHYQTGTASFYGGKWHGKKTASGEKFDQNSMTAAHKTLPFGTKVRVTNLSNGKTVIVRINNRGPYSKGRIIDLSKGVFSKIENISKGVTKVKLEILK